MLKVATAKEMQHIDSVTIKKYGIAGTVLMERAGLRVVGRINELYPDKKVIVLCGGGNNGGDGFVIARELHNIGREVEVYLCVKAAGLKGDAKVNYDALKKFGVKIYSINKFLSHISSHAKCNSIIVDALLGTGLSKDVKVPLSNVIKKVNRMSCPVVSVDIPTGICSDTGQVMGCAVKADHTVTFGLLKRGHILYPGAENAGNVFVEDIGFPQELLESKKIRVQLALKKDAVSSLPSRPDYSHKGTYGHVLLVAGSKGKTGAALMAARACLRTGAGLVTIGVPETVVNSLQGRVMEEMILPLPDTGNGTLAKEAAEPILEFAKSSANVLALGPGLSMSDEISELVLKVVKELSVPAVIDADGINAIANNVALLKKSKAPIVLTPHTGEMARLIRRSGKHAPHDESSIRSDIEQNRIQTALAFAKRTNTYVVLKGVPTVIAAPDGNVYLNSTGNPGMATAGSGDVLTGMISALLAQSLSPVNASIVGVLLHGLIGDAAAGKRGEFSLVASDLIEGISKVLHSCSPE